jgi:hypothetical protein
MRLLVRARRPSSVESYEQSFFVPLTALTFDADVAGHVPAIAA